MSKNNSDQLPTNQSNPKKQDRWFVNYQIKLPKIICIDNENKNLGLIPTNEALKLAQEIGLDLVQISPPNKEKNTAAICKILDYGKFKYEQSKKNKEMAKKNRESIIKLKEVKVTPNTGDNDLKFKAKQIDGFLEEGCRVKISLVFKGREASHSELGYMLLDKFLALVTEKYVMEQNIAFDRSGLTTIIIGE